MCGGRLLTCHSTSLAGLPTALNYGVHLISPTCSAIIADLSIHHPSLDLPHHLSSSLLLNQPYLFCSHALIPSTPKLSSPVLPSSSTNSTQISRFCQEGRRATVKAQRPRQLHALNGFPLGLRQSTKNGLQSVLLCKLWSQQ
jgi:hypothetical protein